MERFALVFTALVLLAPSSTALASPQDLFGFGSRSTAMASTGVSFANDYEATFLNPAGVSRIRTNHLVLGLNGTGFQTTLDGANFPVNPSRAITIGAGLPIPFGGVMRDRLAIGLGFWTPAGVLLTANSLYADIPQLVVVDRSQAIAVQVALGLDLHGVVDGLRLGGGVSGSGGFTGNITAALDATGRFGSVTETQLLTSYSPLVGASYEAGDFSLGLTWRGEIISRFLFDIVVRDLPVAIPRLTIGGVANFDPNVVALEGSWHPNDEWRVAVNLSYKQWSAFPGLLIATSMRSEAPPRPNFNDIVSPRVGVEYTLRRDGGPVWTFRGGYMYEPTPAPPGRAELRYLDNDRHTFSGGLGFSVQLNQEARFVFDAYVQLSLMQPRTHAAPVEGGSANMVTSGYWLGGGWTTGIHFQ